MDKKFSTRLRYALKYRNKRQVDLSNDTGLSQALISQYMSDKFEPKNDKLSVISEYLNVSPLFLMGWHDDPGTYSQDLVISGADDFYSNEAGFVAEINEDPNGTKERDLLLANIVVELKDLTDEQLEIIISVIKNFYTVQ